MLEEGQGARDLKLVGTSRFILTIAPSILTICHGLQQFIGRSHFWFCVIFLTKMLLPKFGALPPNKSWLTVMLYSSSGSDLSRNYRDELHVSREFLT